MQPTVITTPIRMDARSILESLEDDSVFSVWRDSETNVASYVLNKRVAPLQQSFYYVNTSISSDGRYLWFYCAFPPSSGRVLGLIDFSTGTSGLFPDSEFTGVSPLVDERNGDVYWANDVGIWRRSPDFESRPVLINRFSSEFLQNRILWSYCTHLSFDSSGTKLILDSRIGDNVYLAAAPLNGEPIEIWQELGEGYNHAQANPKIPNLVLFSQDNYLDRSTWKVVGYENRMWTLEKGGKAMPVFPENPCPDYNARIYTGHYRICEARPVTDARSMHGHEWWAKDGKSIWYMHYGKGAERVPFGKTEPTLVFPHKTISHAHADKLDKYIVCDSLPPDDPNDRRVSFFNIQTGRQLEVVSYMQDLDQSLQRYHIHPHPQFCLNDQLICYTTVVEGRVDIAFTKVSELLEATS